MSITAILIIVIAIGTIVSGILLLKQSATKFDLSEQELKRIKERNKTFDSEEKKDE